MEVFKDKAAIVTGGGGAACRRCRVCQAQSAAAFGGGGAITITGLAATAHRTLRNAGVPAIPRPIL